LNGGGAQHELFFEYFAVLLAAGWQQLQQYHHYKVHFSHFFVAPALLRNLVTNVEQASVVKFFLSWELFPKLHFLLRVKLDMAQFFFFRRFYLDVDFVLWFSYKSVEVLEVGIYLLLKAGCH